MRIALIGATGQLGSDLLPRLRAAGHDVLPLGHTDIEISDAEPLSRSLDVIHPRQRPLSQEALGLLKTLRAAVGEEAGSPRRQARKANASPVNGSRPSG